MVRFRPFQNSDPPHLASIWNEAFPGRAAYLLRNSAPLERWILSKPYFDPKGLIIAEDEDRFPVGFVHAGFGPNETRTALDYSVGVTCIIALRYSHRRQKIGKDLLQKSEEYLIARGAKVLYAGAQKPLNPFYFGLYGGSDSPGFLSADADAGPFFLSQGYQVASTVQVFHRKLDQPIDVVDTRFSSIKRRFEMEMVPRSAPANWWDECIQGPIEPEPMQFRLVDKRTNSVAAYISLWEMEGFSWRWNFPAAGLMETIVAVDYRRQGLAKYLLTQVLRYLQEQFFGVVEIQNPDKNDVGATLFSSLGFEQVDLGRSYRKEVST